MRQLMHSDFNQPIRFEEGKVNVLVIESPPLLVKYLQQLAVQVGGGEGEFIFSNGLKPEPLSRQCELIIDPFHLDFASRKIQAGIVQDLKQCILEDMGDQQWLEVKGMLEQFLSKVAYSSDIPMNYVGSLTPSEVLKLGTFSVDTENQSWADILQTYVKVVNRFLGADLFIFCSVLQYFGKEELELFIQFCQYQKCDMLFIESWMPRDILPNEKILVVDKDLCVF